MAKRATGVRRDDYLGSGADAARCHWEVHMSLVRGTPLRDLAVLGGADALAVAALLAEALAEVEDAGGVAVELAPDDAVLAPDGARVTLVGARVAEKRAPRIHVEHIAAWLEARARTWRAVDRLLGEWAASPPAGARAAAARLRAAGATRC